MKFYEIFPTVFHHSPDKTSGYWNEEIDLDNVSTWEQLNNYVQRSWISGNSNQETYKMLHRATLNDIYSATQLHKHEEQWHFFQFMMCTFIASYYVQNKLFTYTFDYLVAALTIEEQISVKREYVPEKILAFIQSDDPFISRNIQFTLIVYMDCLFYYARSTGVLNDLCDFCLKSFGRYYFYTVFSRNANEPFMTKSLCQILTWANKHQKADISVLCLERLNALLHAPMLPQEQKKQITIQLSSSKKNQLGKTPKQWGEIVLQQYGDLLGGHERLQVLINIHMHDDMLAGGVLRTIQTSIEEYQKYLKEHSSSPLTLAYEISNIYRTLFPLLIFQLKKGHHNTANQLLQKYFSIQVPVVTDVMHILPNDDDGVSYLHPSFSSLDKMDIRTMVRETVEATNNFLGTTIYFTDDINYVPKASVEPGKPDEKFAIKFEQQLSRHFNFQLIEKNIKAGNVNQYFLHNGYNLPLQPIMVKQIGTAVPMTLSVERPLNQRPIRKMFLWKGYSLFDFECEGIEMIMKSAGIEVVQMDGETTSVNEFIQHYENEDYDLFWVSGHGQFNHFEPHLSYIHLQHGKELNIEQINTLKTVWKDRRLFFLNICDGATTSMQNSPAAIGIGAKLANQKQSLFSHLWPVQPLVAVAQGWVMAVALIEEQSNYLKAYNKTISCFEKGQDKIVETLQPYLGGGELLDRLRNTSLDFRNFAHRGSLAYFQ